MPEQKFQISAVKSPLGGGYLAMAVAEKPDGGPHTFYSADEHGVMVEFETEEAATRFMHGFLLGLQESRFKGLGESSMNNHHRASQIVKGQEEGPASSMGQDRIISVVERSGIEHQQGARQKQWHQVRFSNKATCHSLNLGYSLPRGLYIADFVFKGQSREANLHNCQIFNEQFGGTLCSKSTVFCRIEVPVGDDALLISLIQNYWNLSM